MRISHLVGVVAASFAFVIPGVALAHGGGGAALTEVPPAPPGDGAAAEGVLRELEPRAAKDPEIAKVVAEPIKNAKQALARAHGARAAGDTAHARMLDSLALGWAEAARDLEHAATAERVAAATLKKAHEVQTKADRARALLEETQARRGRAAAELEHAEVEAKAGVRGAADTEAQRLEVAKKKAAKAEPKKAGKGSK